MTDKNDNFSHDVNKICITSYSIISVLTNKIPIIYPHHIDLSVGEIYFLTSLLVCSFLVEQPECQNSLLSSDERMDWDPMAYDVD